MKETIQLLADIVNNLHDFIQIYVSSSLNLSLTDKDLHFWIMGFIGIVVFLFVLVISKIIVKMPFGITILSFLYTTTFMFVLVFAIEIQQALTNRGNMEFEDALVGLLGFFAFFLVFVVIAFAFFMTRRLLKSLFKK
ncbi:hypothetical protein E2K98_13920 [Bacillus salipaludis]|uniref:Uncharacterized protein n=1 Tax=Bacillus salipaludis TaxID=2547811 RepID=A0A4R5VR16_9BACI|nr:hypothetical protein [Bacillus salipaludis]MDQ6598635.1 hypothetical protein [Bacillus salipaludis]TDK60819.1 hypothetical protein E2K98_13920 [Bacillus salipaludis]